nr:hypothetical protein [Lentibacillus sp. CBA3610]
MAYNGLVPVKFQWWTTQIRNITKAGNRHVRNY